MNLYHNAPGKCTGSNSLDRDSFGGGAVEIGYVVTI